MARTCKTFLLVVLLLSGLLNVFGRSVHHRTRHRRSSGPWSAPASRSELQDALNALEREQEQEHERYEPKSEYGASPLAFLFGNELSDRHTIDENDDDDDVIGSPRAGDYDADYESADADLGTDFSDDDLVSSLPTAEEKLRERLSYDDYDGFEPENDDSDEANSKQMPRPADMRELAKLLALNGNEADDESDNDLEEQKTKKDFDHRLSLQKPVTKRLKVSEVKTLLDDVEDISHDNVKGVKEDKVQAGKDENGNDVMIKSTTVSKEEINNILGDDDDDKEESANNEKESSKDNDSEASKAITKEEIIEAFINDNKDEGSSSSEKEISRKKRPAKRDNREVSIPKEDIEKMYTLLDTYAIESKLIATENEYLANALNSATLGQIEHTDAYLGKQYKFLEKAVNVEESLQNLKEDLENGERPELPDEEEDEDVLEDAIDEEILNEALEKRTAQYNKQTADDDDDDDDDGSEDGEEQDIDNTVYDKNEDNTEDSTWYDRPIPRSFVMPAKGSVEYNQLNPFLREILEGYGPYRSKLDKRADGGDPVEEMASDETIDGATNDDESAESDDEEAEDSGLGEEATEREIASTLEDLIDSMKPWQRRKLEGEINEIIAEADQCPAVDALSNHCADIMKGYAVDLDEEARSVCDRHRLCYSCGASLDLSHGKCDELFLEEANKLCKNNETCKEGAAGLFLLMDKEHKFSTHKSKACSQRCVAEFIFGLGN